MTQAGLEFVKSAILARRHWWANVVALGVTLAVAAGIRLLVDGGRYGFPFLTFFPVILVSAIFLGWRYGVMAAIVAPVVMNVIFLRSPWLMADQPGQWVILAIYACMIAFIVLTGEVVRKLVEENEKHSQQQEAFNAELQHRTKNALQIMRALIARGPRGEDPKTYFETLAGRLDALAKANELLRFGVLDSARMLDLVGSAVAPFEDGERIRFAGPDCKVSRQAATPLMMALHELCTNASKYGALSGEHGAIAIEWRVLRETLPPTVCLTWEEIGGPRVTPPRHRGLGTRLLTPNGGLTDVRLDWRSEGLICEMTALGAA